MLSVGLALFRFLDHSLATLGRWVCGERIHLSDRCFDDWFSVLGLGVDCEIDFKASKTFSDEFFCCR